MEKEILTKIYKLRNVKPSADFKETTKQNILSQDVYSDTNNVVLSAVTNILAFRVFEKPQFQAIGALAMILVFGFFAFPIINSNNQDYQYTIIDIPQQLSKTEETKIVSEGESKPSVAVTEEKKQPIQQEFASIEEHYREIQLMVLAARFGVDQNEEDIAMHAINEMEQTQEAAQEMISILVENNDSDEKEELVKQAKEALENGDNYKVFDIYLQFKKL